MRSHTVPQKLLEHFAYDDLVTRSKRLWRYEKGLPPYGRTAPKSATRRDGHFADPENVKKESEVEARLKKELEDPVNQFIGLLNYRTFPFTQTHRRLLTVYITVLFHRTQARRAASDMQTDNMIRALRELRDDEYKIAQITAKQNNDLVANGLLQVLTREDVLGVIDQEIEKFTRGDTAQRQYVHTMETMMAFRHDAMEHGEWNILRAEPDKPFVIGDAPVVTWERTEQDTIVRGPGFGRQNVEVLLPVFPTACLHVLPAYQRNRQVRIPTTDEVNGAQAAFASRHCFTNVNSTELNALLQPNFGTFRLGIDGFSTAHLNHKEKLFEILMNQASHRGHVDAGEN